MKSGKLTETIQLRSVDATLNEYGTAAVDGYRLRTVRAERIDQTTEEYLRGFGASDEETVIFRIRHLEGVTNAHQLVWQGEVFNIRQVTPIGRRKGLDLRCARLTG